MVTAILVKRATEDGLVEFEDHVPLGRRYRVDLDSIVRAAPMTHDPDGKNISHRKDIIYTEDGGWLPLECLKLLEN